MVKLTMIARVTDGLPLAEGLDDGRDVKDIDLYKQQVKALFKNLAIRQNEPSRMSIETGHLCLSYIIEERVCYLTMCDRAYPKKLAFQYLEDLKNEFERVNGAQIETAARPYAFIKFGNPSCLRRYLYHLLDLFVTMFFFCVFQILLYREQRNCTRTHIPNGTLLS
ncbi:25.3 kDa vesicle transport protein [Linum grandiflorum]